MGQKANDNHNYYFAGKLLIATPELDGTFFNRSVIYICAHNESGAMGLVINQTIPSIATNDILQQLQLDSTISLHDFPVHLGGPVDANKGFILHSNDYTRNETVKINQELSLTSDIEVLRDIAKGSGPEHSLFTLGYAGWGEGQLEEEIKHNAWFPVNADDDIMFSTPDNAKWDKAAQLLGIAGKNFTAGGNA